MLLTAVRMGVLLIFFIGIRLSVSMRMLFTFRVFLIVILHDSFCIWSLVMSLSLSIVLVLLLAVSLGMCSGVCVGSISHISNVIRLIRLWRSLFLLLCMGLLHILHVVLIHKLMLLFGFQILF